jgi:hypothetical protein
MFDDKLRQEIADFVEKDAKDIVELRAQLMQLIHDVVKQMIDSRNDELDKREDALEKFAAISLEISESIFNNVYNAQPLAASALVEWQVNLFRTSASIFTNDAQFDSWAGGGLPMADGLSQLVRDMHKRRCAIDPTAMLKPAPPETLLDDIAGGHLIFLNMSLDYLYDAATALEFDDQLNWQLRYLLVADVILLSQIALVFVCYVASHAGTRPGDVEKWMRAYNNVEGRIMRLRSDLATGGESVN